MCRVILLSERPLQHFKDVGEEIEREVSPFFSMIAGILSRTSFWYIIVLRSFQSTVPQRYAQLTVGTFDFSFIRDSFKNYAALLLLFR